MPLRLKVAVALGVSTCAAGGMLVHSAPPDGAFRVIVSANNPLTSVKRDDLARIFLKKLTRSKDGQELSPVDQSARSAVRAAFSERVLVKEGLDKISAVENYWRQQIYSGRGNPPAVKTSDDDVRKFVAATPGAIGYVSEKADLTGVKAVTVQD
jgi:ABC-type phosphate transport system substrate-binding protein